MNDHRRGTDNSIVGGGLIRKGQVQIGHAYYDIFSLFVCDGEAYRNRIELNVRHHRKREREKLSIGIGVKIYEGDTKETNVKKKISVKPNCLRCNLMFNGRL